MLGLWKRAQEDKAEEEAEMKLEREWPVLEVEKGRLVDVRCEAHGGEKGARDGMGWL